MLSNPAINILMIEDNTGDQYLLADLLESSDLNIKNLFFAIRLDKALEQLSENIDIILLDLSLPDSDGINTFHEIIQKSGSTPVVILSGMSDTKVALDAITLGAQDYLIKGDFDEKLLSKSIRYSIERKKNMEALLESNERYNLVSKATNDMVWDWNITTGKIYRNLESWNKIFGSSLLELPSNNNLFLERIHPDDKAYVIKTLDIALENPNQLIFTVECRAVKDDGGYVHISDVGYIIRDSKGKAIRIIGAAQDISDRKNAEVILRSSEERYKYLFNNNPACIIIWDLSNFSILEVNDSAMEQYNYTKEEFLKKSVLDLRMPDDVAEIRELAQKARENVFFKVTSTWKHINKQGHFMFMDITSHRIEYYGKPVILALASNVTEKVLLEKKLEEEQLKKQIEITDAVITAQERERSEIGGELHDNVNQILASARLYLGLAKRELPKPLTFLEETDNLIFSAISEIRKLSHSMIPPSLNETELIEALNNLVNRIKVSGSVNVEVDLKKFNEENFSDKLKLTIYRIVQEQFNNILKHSQASNIKIYLGYENQQLILSITDDGHGFEKSKKTEGVGLMNIRTRAALFNGDMTIKSSPGHGCELKIIFR
ncbi:hypothetical protein BH11BAC3_BH11BAC3_01020 [soil metagenome]